MVQVTVKGRALGEGVNAKIIMEATCFMMKILIHDDEVMLNCIKIIVIMVEGFEHDTGDVAQCIWTDDYRQPMDFEIRIDSSLSLVRTLKTLGHELTHVKQLALGEKTQSACGKVQRWMGHVIDVDNTHYYDLPWEVQAHGMEYGLYDRFMLHLTQDSGIEYLPNIVKNPMSVPSPSINQGSGKSSIRKP